MKKYFLIFVLCLFLINISYAETTIIYVNNDALFTQAVASVTYSTLISATSVSPSANPTLPQGIYTTSHATTTDRFIRNSRYAMTFDTSNLSSYTITSAKIRIKFYSKTLTFSGGQNESTIVTFSPANPTSFISSDYDNFGSEVVTRLDYTSVSTGNLNYTLNSNGINHINKTGYTSFYFLDGDEIDGSFSSTWAASLNKILRFYGHSDATEGNRPYLEVSYTIPTPTTTETTVIPTTTETTVVPTTTTVIPTTTETILPNQTLSIYPYIVTNSSIVWNWSSNLNITKISIDGKVISNYDYNATKLVINNLDSNSKHKIIIYTNNSYGSNSTFTLNTEKSSTNILFDLILTYVILIIAIIFIVLSIWVPLFSIISLFIGIMNLVFTIKSGDFYLDMISAMIILASCLMIYRGGKE